jgi:hypothetical protein
MATANRLRAPQHFAVCKWLESIRDEAVRDSLRPIQIARRAAAKFGHPVTARNVSYAARAIGLDLSQPRPTATSANRGGPRQRLRSVEVLAADLIEAEARIRELATRLNSMLREFGLPLVDADRFQPVDPNVRRIAKGIAMIHPTSNNPSE